ncbi:SDR family NAD(P)-dependent oxidoreductase [Parasphaerochaeta coccoides]|uniref:3-oxoacyl-(Acyl-carrier-protein) reductase n=1 Tax=Parasphaerochaeta coccoides (strain ATCC BAA-1237 / DSM 17374 / SPN1) TaxID=760011 RepID=F4GJJ8_PARC1|nr:SDR family oxidoreductase [Parasphaerochaeta coccoides]AEC02263.1 3-oxoacyl-(acyl-carrier-protein) reductase [Parasphaerochaeta coccoides DSM 17374]
MKEIRVAMITGAASGIGRAAAKKFSENGYAVAMIDKNTAIKEVEDELRKNGAESFGFSGDVSRETDVKAFVEETLTRYGRIDVLNCNAGIVVVKPLEETTYDEFLRVAEVNIGGTFLMHKYVLPVMKRQNKGSIVNLGSVSGHVGQTEHAIYGATKGAVISFTRSIAWEAAKWNIRINSVSPGSVDTPMLRSDIQLEATRTGKSFEDVKRLREAEQAFDRWADPSEIATAIYFLASDEASFITGSDLLVDCGWVAK